MVRSLRRYGRRPGRDDALVLYESPCHAVLFPTQVGSVVLGARPGTTGHGRPRVCRPDVRGRPDAGWSKERSGIPRYRRGRRQQDAGDAGYR